ncbi:hypothetical protein HDU98_007160, partial [Podochytrium sp. JEL0797]
VRPDTDQIVLINVRAPAILPGRFGALKVDFQSEIDAIDAADKQQSHDLLRAYANKLPINKYNIRGVALRGDARDELMWKVEDIGANMLVIGSRGLSGFKKALMGSVSEYLVHHCKVPVVVARPPEK